MGFQTGPLHFPENRDLRVERYLTPYGLRREPGQDVGVSDFVVRLIREEKWYGIMSARGTGKTSLLHDLIYQLEAAPDHPVLALPRIDLGIYHGEREVERVLSGLAQEIANGLQERGQPSPLPLREENSRAGFVGWLGEAVRPLRRGGRPARVLLCLDDFERLEPDVQRALPEQFKKLHENYRGRVTCLIATDIDLQKTGRDLSPLHGLLDLYSLVDYSREGEWEQLAQIARDDELRVGDDAWQALREATGGDPFWVSAILARVAETQPGARVLRSNVQRAIADLLETRPEPRPVERFLEALESWEDEPSPERVALNLVSLLLQSPVPLNGNEVAFEALALKGIARADENGNITWRNSIIARFVRKHEGEVEERANPELRLGHLQRGRGKIHVTLVMNLSRFVRRKDKARFDDLRATSEYADAVEELEARFDAPREGQSFELNSVDDHLRNIGTDLYIFTHQAAESAFTPVYYLKEAPKNYRRSSTFAERVKDGSLEPEAHEQVIRAEWSKWNEMSVQLTREGTAVVRLVRAAGYHEKPPKLFAVLEDVLGLEGEISAEAEKEKAKQLVDGGDWRQAEQQVQRIRTLEEARKYRRQIDRSVQWEIGMSLVEALIREAFPQSTNGGAPDYRCWQIGKQTLELAPGGEPDIAGGQAGEREPIYPLHDRYVVFEFDKLCDCPDNDHSTILEARDFSDPQRRREIAGLLEGVAVEHSRGQGFPNIKESEARKQLGRDLSSWQGELCLITVDNALIYYKLPERQEHSPSPETATDGCEICPACFHHEKKLVQHIYFPGRGHVAYADYWGAVVRGLDYVVGLRLIAQLVAQRTADYMAEAADLSRLLGDDAKIEEDTRLQVIQLRRKIANAAQLLSVVRGAAIPLSIARSDYAARKFESLIRLSGIRAAVRSAEGNLRDLNAFLVHYDEISMEVSNNKTLESIKELTDMSQQGNIAAVRVSIIIALGILFAIWAQILQAIVLWWVLIFGSAVLVGLLMVVAFRDLKSQMQAVARRHHPEKYDKPARR